MPEPPRAASTPEEIAERNSLYFAERDRIVAAFRKASEGSRIPPLDDDGLTLLADTAMIVRANELKARQLAPEPAGRKEQREAAKALLRGLEREGVELVSTYPDLLRNKPVPPAHAIKMLEDDAQLRVLNLAMQAVNEILTRAQPLEMWRPVASLHSKITYIYGRLSPPRALTKADIAQVIRWLRDIAAIPNLADDTIRKGLRGEPRPPEARFKAELAERASPSEMKH
jgi:hypothetical protein